MIKDFITKEELWNEITRSVQGVLPPARMNRLFALESSLGNERVFVYIMPNGFVRAESELNYIPDNSSNVPHIQKDENDRIIIELYQCLKTHVDAEEFEYIKDLSQYVSKETTYSIGTYFVLKSIKKSLQSIRTHKETN